MESTEICEVSLVDDSGLLSDSVLDDSPWTQPVIFPSNSLNHDLASKISTLSIPIAIVPAPVESQHLVEGFLLGNDELPDVDRQIILHQIPEEIIGGTEVANKTVETETLVNFSGNGYEICIQNEKQSELSNPHNETSKVIVRSADNDVDPPDRTGGPKICETCELTFTTRKEYKKHVQSHLHDKPYKCPQCPESFNYECNLNAHVSTHNVSNPFCIVCKRHFARIAGLRAHVLMHQCDDTLFCPECLEEFSSQSLLEKHKLEHERGAAVFKFYECNQCENAYGSQNALRDHLKIVHGVKFLKKMKKRKGSYVCDYCKKRFEKPSQLIRHKRIHTGERPFKCESCGKAFGQKGSLQIHMLKHSGDKPFKCIHCVSCFSQKGNLRAHVIRMHPELYNESRSFKCKLCDCAFQNATKLANHATQFHSGNTESPELENPKVISLGDTSNKENEEKLKTRITAVSSTGDGRVESDSYGLKRGKPTDPIKNAGVRVMPADNTFKEDNHVIVSKTVLPQVKEELIDFFVCTVCNELLCSEEERDNHKKLHQENKTEEHVEPSTPLVSNSLDSASNLFSNVTKILVLQNGTFEFVKGNLILQCFGEANTNNDSNSNVGTATSTDQSTGDEIMDSEKLYQCDKCDRSFEALSHWKAHCRAHKDDKPMADSSLSPRSVSSKMQSPLQTPSHLESRTCKVCDKSFSSLSSLKRHMECHDSNASTYSCNLCPRQYKSRATFQKHLNSHAKVQTNKTEQSLTKVPEKDDNAVDFQGDWNDLIQSLQPGQQYSFDIADGSADSPGKRLEVRLVKNTSRTEMMNAERIEKSVPVAAAITEPAIINGDISQNMTAGAGSGQSCSNPPEKPQRRKVFECDQCREEFDSLMQLSIHKTTHVKMTCKTCPICQKTFNSVTSYEKHVRSCTKRVVVNENVQSFKCKHCGVGFFSERDFKNHVKVNHVLTTCEVCNRAFKCKVAHDFHVKEHYTIRGIYNCGICNAVFSTEEEIVQHIEIHPIDRPKETKKKRTSFSRPTTTKKLTEEERKLLSSVPPKSVSEKALLNAIIEVERQKVQRFQNGIKNEITESSEEVHPNKCPYCPKSFRKPSDLVRHVRIHTGERPYKCTVCNKTFSIKSTAYSHVKTHTKDKSYNCHLCHKEFACIGSLKVHMRLHTGSMPFSCEICHAKFRTSGHKKAHLANHLKNASSSPKEKNQARPKSEQNRGRSKATSKGNVTVALSNISTITTDATTTTAAAAATTTITLTLPSSYSEVPPPSDPAPPPPIPTLSPADEVAQTVQYMPSLGESIIYDDSVRDILGNGLVRLDDCSSTDVLDLSSLPDNGLTLARNDKPVEPRKFICVYCVKAFDTQEELIAHAKTHRFLECSVCHQSFKCKTDLEVHTLVHEFDQWSCNGCSLAFDDQTTFKKHKCSTDSLSLGVVGGGVVNDLKELTASTLDLSLEVNDLFLFPPD